MKIPSSEDVVGIMQEVLLRENKIDRDKKHFEKMKGKNETFETRISRQPKKKVRKI